MRNQKKSLKKINILFMVLSILLFSTAWIMQKNETITGILITEYGFVFLLPILYLFYYDFSIKDYISVDLLSWSELGEIFAVMILVYPLLLIFHGVSGFSLRDTVTSLTMPRGNLKVLSMVLLMVFTPAICEELAFRGVFLNNYKELGKETAIVLSGIYFAMFHRYFFQFPHAFALGLILGYLAWEKQNLFAAIWGHFAYNALSFILNYRLSRENINLNYISHISLMDGIVLLIMLISLVIVFTYILFWWKKPQWSMKNLIQGLKQMRLKESWPILFTFILYILVNIF